MCRSVTVSSLCAIQRTEGETQTHTSTDGDTRQRSEKFDIERNYVEQKRTRKAKVLGTWRDRRGRMKNGLLSSSDPVHAISERTTKSA